MSAVNCISCCLTHKVITIINVHINIIEWTAKLMCDWHIDGLIYCGLSVIRIACMTNLLRMAS